MMNVIYCPDHDVRPVVAAGRCFLPTVHTHADGTQHDCLLVAVADEPDLPGVFPAKMLDGSVVNSVEEWLAYLGKYVPGA